jgi:hypothetical protein
MSDVPPEEDPRPRRRRLGGWGGCLLWLFVWLFVVAAGCSVGLVLRPDPHAPAQVASGEGWKVQVHNTKDGDQCVELVIGNEIRTAQCGYVVDGRFKETSYGVGGNQTVIFAPVPDDVTHVRLRLADGSRPLVETGRKKDITYFVHLSDVADKGHSELLDAQGQIVTP